MADQDIAEQLKSRNLIEDVISEDGYPLGGHGRYRRAAHQGGLVVDTQKQYYDWNSKGEAGDVFTWLENRHNWDFKQAASFLAKRCGMPEPIWKKEDAQARVETRKKEDTFEVATTIFERWLWADEAALAYVRSRGWSDNTIHAAHLGYSGNSKNLQKILDEFLSELKIANADFSGPAAVALAGFAGDVREWGIEHNVDVQEKWLINRRIPGMIGRDMLLYPHFEGSKVVYFTGRFLHPKDRKSDNPPVELLGPKKPYYSLGWNNHKSNARVICEGQADAITLWHEWEIPSMALCGVHADPALFTTYKNKIFYIGLDADTAGKKIAPKSAEAIGPMCRLIQWSPGKLKLMRGEEEVPIKDANDLLQAYAQNEISNEDQRVLINNQLAAAKTLVETTAAEVGTCSGAEKEEAQKKTIELMLKMDEIDLSLKRSTIAKMLNISVRDLDNTVRTMRTKGKKDESKESPELIYGGYIGDHLIEYLYDGATQRASLVWRAPDGTIHTGNRVQIDGKWYEPVQDDLNVIKGGVLFPSQLGQLKTTRELAVYLEDYVKSVVVLPSKLEVHIVVYYIMLTWLYDAFEAIPYLRAMGAPDSGKSELMKRIGLACYRRIIASGISTTSSLFRTVDQYKGTLYMDEMDLKLSDASVEQIKFLNIGYTRDGMITRMEESTGEEGRKIFKPTMYQAFCPKLLTMQKDFFDTATGTRCLTFKHQQRGMQELDAAGIPLSITKEMRDKALVLRNMLLRWRLEHWRPTIEIRREFLDYEISTRLNQVSGPILAIAVDDPEMQKEIHGFLRAYHMEQIVTRSMTIAARVVEAIWKIHKYPDLRATMVVVDKKTGDEKILVGHITQIANQIIDMMNMSTEDDEDSGSSKKKRKEELHPQKIGKLIREELQLSISERTMHGYYIFWDQVRMEALATRYGINVDEIGATGEDKPAMIIPQNDVPGEPEIPAVFQEESIPENED